MVVCAIATIRKYMPLGRAREKKRSKGAMHRKSVKCEYHAIKPACELLVTDLGWLEMQHQMRYVNKGKQGGGPPGVSKKMLGCSFMVIRQYV